MASRVQIQAWFLTLGVGFQESTDAIMEQGLNSMDYLADLDREDIRRYVR